MTLLALTTVDNALGEGDGAGLDFSSLSVSIASGIANLHDKDNKLKLMHFYTMTPL
jgi:hypothetical protein